MFTFVRRDRGVGVAFSDRHGGVSPLPRGSLNLGSGELESPEDLAENFRRVAQTLNVARFVTLTQVHGSDVVDVDEQYLRGWTSQHHLRTHKDAEPPARADALVSAVRAQEPVALTIRVADCVPVLLADPAAGVIGAAHAGRQGFDLNVVVATVERMRALGAQQISAWIGPHICGRCYEVPPAMHDDVVSRHPAASSTTSWGTPALDLGAGVAAQLAQEGVPSERVEVCTFESADHHSYRRDGLAAGRLAALIWLE